MSYSFKEVFDIYTNYILSDLIWSVIIVIGAFALIFAYIFFKRFFRNKKGGDQ